jgi:outer membrane lipoprotein-sorting protein
MKTIRKEGGMSARTANVIYITLALWMTVVVWVWAQAQEPSAVEVLERTRAAWQGESFHSLVNLEVTQGTQTRSYRIEVWTQGEDKALLRMLAPTDEAGSGYLLVDETVWYYSPLIGSATKLPSAALGDAVFGAGPALEDLFRGTLSEDYDTTMVVDEAGYSLTLVPHLETPVVYGRLDLRVRKDFALEEIVYVDQRGEVLRTATFGAFLALSDRVLPTEVTIEEANGDLTIERLKDPQFNIKLDPALFTVETLENP